MTIEVNASNMKEIMGTDYYQTTYRQSRKDRLCDIIGDYVTDEDTSADEFVQELKSELNTWLDYHQKHFEKCKEMSNLLGGN